VIAGVVDTGDKFLTCVNDTGEQLSAATTTLAINLSRWQHRWKIIAVDNDTGDKLITGDKNKDAMEVGSCQR
jgi:hypothetical protein